MNTIKSTKVISALFSMTLLAACGGGSSGSTRAPTNQGDVSLDDSQTDEISDDNLPPAPSPSTSLADFTVVSIVTTAVLDSENRNLEVLATIRNDGTKTEEIPVSWFMVSADPDFTNDYFHIRVDFRAQTSTEDERLSPGESGIFSLRTEGSSELSFSLSRSGAHYARLWVNPDRSARFESSNDSLEPYHDVDESDYGNNISELTAFNNNLTAPEDDCALDAYEPNDAIEEATLLTLGEFYDFNACDEKFEVMEVFLKEEMSYRLKRGPNDAGQNWSITVVSPDNTYLTEISNKDEGFFMATQTGKHYIAAHQLGNRLGGELSFGVVPF